MSAIPTAAKRVGDQSRTLEGTVQTAPEREHRRAQE